MATNPHIYVSSEYGTNDGTGGDTSQASAEGGAITNLTASDVYESLHAAVDGCSPGAGDTIYVDNRHSANYDPLGSFLLNASSTVYTAPLNIISVNYQDMDSYLKFTGTGDHLNETNDEFNLRGVMSLYGVKLESGDNTITISSNSYLRFYDCEIVADGGGDYAIYSVQVQAFVELYGTHIKINTATASAFVLGDNTQLKMYGGSIDDCANIFLANTHGGSADLYGVDLSLFDGNLIDASMGDNNTSYIVRLFHCKLNSAMAMPNITTIGARCELYGCDDTTSDNQHQFYIDDAFGTAQNVDNTTYLTATPTWFGGTVRSSIKIDTKTRCNEAQDFRIDLSTELINFADTDHDVVEVYLTSDTQLKDSDVRVIMFYPDGTDKVFGNMIISGSYKTPLDTGTNLTDDSSAGRWTGEKTYEQKISLDTSSDVGAKGVPKLILEMTNDVANSVYVGIGLGTS